MSASAWKIDSSDSDDECLSDNRLNRLDEDKPKDPLKNLPAFGLNEEHMANDGWWKGPILFAAQTLVQSKGKQERDLAIATCCSGTEAPLLALKAWVGGHGPERTKDLGVL